MGGIFSPPKPDKETPKKQLAATLRQEEKQDRQRSALQAASRQSGRSLLAYSATGEQGVGGKKKTLGAG